MDIDNIHISHCIYCIYRLFQKIEQGTAYVYYICIAVVLLNIGGINHGGNQHHGYQDDKTWLYDSVVVKGMIL